MMEDKPGIGGEQFQLTLKKETWGYTMDIGIDVKVVQEPVWSVILHEYAIVNWWRKITGTEVHGYKYTVKIVD